MIINRFAFNCDDPHIACIKAEREMTQLRADNARLTAENAALRERCAWVPVAEREPPAFTDVIVTGGSLGDDMRVLWHEGGMNFTSDANTQYHVTHWMPLPPAAG